MYIIIVLSYKKVGYDDEIYIHIFMLVVEVFSKKVSDTYILCVFTLGNYFFVEYDVICFLCVIISHIMSVSLRIHFYILILNIPSCLYDVTNINNIALSNR